MMMFRELMDLTANPQWPMTPINGNCKIIGVAIETKMRLV